jgi:tetratricopeptide (TPR) repeat protein
VLASAVFLALLLGSGIIAAAVYFAGSRPPPAAPSDDADRLEAERNKNKQLAEELARLKEKRREGEGRKEPVAKVVPEVPDEEGPKEDEGAKRKATLEGLLEQARKAYADKEYPLAVRTYERARDLAPADPVVLKELAQAQAALDRDVEAKKKLADYRAHMAAARAAFANERYADAIVEYRKALEIVPNDPDAIAGQRRAEARIAALNDQEKAQLRFNSLIESARKNQAAKRFNAAVENLVEATRTIPEDRDAKELLRKARAQLKQAKSDYGLLVAKGNEAARLGRLEEAYSNYTAAELTWAEDETNSASNGRAAIERAINDARLGALAYQRFMDQAATAFAAGRFAAAVAAYQEALRLRPGDADALAALARAQRAVNRGAADVAGFNKQMKLGTAALKRKDYATAITAFTEALRLVPGNQQAADGLSEARYQRAMVVGQRAMSASRWKEALTAFKEALEAKPGDAVAANFVRQVEMRLKIRPKF